MGRRGFSRCDAGGKALSLLKSADRTRDMLPLIHFCCFAIIKRVDKANQGGHKHLATVASRSLAGRPRMLRAHVPWSTVLLSLPFPSRRPHRTGKELERQSHARSEINADSHESFAVGLSAGAACARPRGSSVEESLRPSPPRGRQERSTFSRPAMQPPAPALLPPEDARALPILPAAALLIGLVEWSRAHEGCGG